MCDRIDEHDDDDFGNPGKIKSTYDVLGYAAYLLEMHLKAIRERSTTSAHRLAATACEDAHAEIEKELSILLAAISRPVDVFGPMAERHLDKAIRSYGQRTARHTRIPATCRN